ncbi:MBL fold metallo-hydrolase [Comamonas humi]
MRYPFSRAVQALTCSLAVLAAAGCTAPPPAAWEQVPGIQRQQIGALQVTALFDGVVALPRSQILGVDAAGVQQLLHQRYVPEDPQGLQTAVNAYLVRLGGKLVLVDTGTARCFGDGLGQVLRHLRLSGNDPAQVDAVLLTHAHPDHLCGLLDGEGRPAYPNAQVYLSREDAAYWLDPANEPAAPEALRPLFGMARDAVAPYEAAGRLQRFGPGEALLPGVTVLPTPGHTPGHVSYLLDAGPGAAPLLVWGDLVHYHAVQLAQPEASYEPDTNRPQAIASRRAMLARAADAGWWVAGAHLPFPGLGHVRREGPAYAWVPTEFGPLRP